MSGARVFPTVAPLRLTLWVVAIGGAVILIMMTIGVTQHLKRGRADRRRERVHGQLAPLFQRFFEAPDRARLADELRPTFMHMDAAERPVAAVLIADLMQACSAPQREQLRHALEQSGLVELGHRGTRRWSPWRRALACEMLGKVGSESSVRVLLKRLKDRRPEVRVAAVRALGEIGSAEAVPALSQAFLTRSVAPTNLVNYALRMIGGEAGPAFERGISSNDPIVRVSSCFGLAGIASTHGSAVSRLAEALATDSDPSVRAAAAASLGIAGGGNAPAELRRATADPHVHVRRDAVKALGSFDDPTAAETLDANTEDEDREVAIRAAEALVALTRRSRAAPSARECLESSSAWSAQYARAVAEVTG